METDLLEQGLELMVAGMGTVFVFLTCLVFATTGMSALVARFQPEETAFEGVTADEVAAISAAIAEHRRRY
jgi:oxaloacetate decarboxylase gamma subunit